MTLVEFLTARLDEAERSAPHLGDCWALMGYECTAGCQQWWSREVEAKRRIVAEHSPNLVGFCPRCRYTSEPVTAPCPTLRALAAIHSGHRDYRHEWRP